MVGWNLGDDRLNASRNRLIEVLGQSPDAGFPEACASDGDTEALYQFLRNRRVSLATILDPLCERIQDVQKKMEITYEAESREVCRIGRATIQVTKL